jgi:uncharacterized phage protein (TIGR01671 family)
MRQIEFRGLRTDGKGWAYGDIVTAFDGLFICPTDYDYKHYNEHWPEGFVEVNPSTVGQFTGIYDRNGVKIWEGDIVRYHFQNSWHKAEMIFNNGAFRIKGWGHGELTHTFEVARNIHETASET